MNILEKKTLTQKDIDQINTLLSDPKCDTLKKVVRKLMKRKQLLPLEEIDARKLIKHRVCKVNVLLADSFDIRQSNSYKSAEENWYENNQIRLKRSPSFNNRSTLSLTPEDRYKTRLEQINNSYKLGLISKEEYERKLKFIKGSK